MDRRLATAAALLGALLAGSACRPGTITVEPRVEVGDRARYRYEIEATITSALEGDEPTTTEIATELLADQEVVAITEDGARAQVTLRRDGAAPRQAQVLLDRSGAIRSVELVEGLASGGLGLAELGSLLPPSSLPPASPLAPGARWKISEGGLDGRGRLDRVGIIDGEEVAVVETSVVEALREAVVAGPSEATIDGELRSVGTAAYDLAGGAVRRSSARSRSEVRARIQPPAGVEAEPVDATITYDIRVRVTRLD